MQPLLPPADVQAALEEFKSWRAKVYHFLFEAPSFPEENAHERAARFGLESKLAPLRQHAPFWNESGTDFSKITFDRALHQNVQQFFGPCYEVSTDTVILRGQTDDFLNDYFREGAEETVANAISQDSLLDNWPFERHAVTLGYAQALFEPPYTLKRHNDFSATPLTNLEIAAAFHRLCVALFGDPNTLEIYAWPTDCSDYFDAGHQWWGSFFWTVYAPSKNWIVTILASATD